MIIRSVVVRTRLSEKEYEKLKKMAKTDHETCVKSGKENLSAYIRKCVLHESGQAKENEKLNREVRELTYQIRKIGVNINQVTKKINEGYYQAEESERLHKSLKEIEEKFESFLEALEVGECGNHKTDEY